MTSLPKSILDECKLEKDMQPQNDPNNDIEQPLLATRSKSQQRPPKGLNVPRTKSLALGMMFGVTVQAMCIGATAIMMTSWGDDTDNSRHVFENEADRLYYWMLWCMAMVTYGIYAASVCVLFLFSVTEQGAEFAKSNIFSLSNDTKVSDDLRRSTFSVGAYLLIGLIVGSFLTWVLVDLYLSLVDLILPACITLATCLILCYAMMICYGK